MVGGFFCLKLDISKAFDKLHWKIIFKSLETFVLSSSWINLVKECIYFLKELVLINGETCGFFSPEYSLRQRDPLSPYLFCLI